ncbi:hypothetical protein BHE90_017754, partial [Fusarium euwallaceae]
RQRGAEGDREHAVRIDPHQHRDVAVLRCRTHGAAKIGGVQEYPEQAAQRHRDREGDQLGHGNIQPADVPRFVRIESVDGAVIGAEQHQREVQQQDRQRERQEDLRHVVRSEHPADQEMLDQDDGAGNLAGRDLVLEELADPGKLVGVEMRTRRNLIGALGVRECRRR